MSQADGPSTAGSVESHGGDVPVWDLPAVARGIESQLARLDELLDRGASLVGWKVGVGAPAAMARAGTTAPLVGFLTSATVLPDGSGVDVSGWRQPAFEPELAVHLTTDVAAGSDGRTVAAAVGGVGPAIELADVDVPLEDVEAVVAGDVYHRAVILGPVDRSRGAEDTADIEIRVVNRGDVVAATTEPTEATGPLLDLVSHVADWLGAAGRRLEAGQVVICGSTVPIVPVAGGDEMVYECAPIGALRVDIRG